MPEACRIAIVDPYPIFREGIVQAISRTEHFSVVAEGTTAEDAERLVRQDQPDILLLEVAVPGSLKAAEAILRAHKNVKVVFLASAEDREHITQALRAGVHGYMLKGITGPELVRAMEVIHGGERYITPDLAWHLVTKPRPAASPAQAKAAGAPHLSVREQQVIDYAARGLTNKEIARILGLGLSTIKHYKTLAFKKMAVRNRLEAIAKAGQFAKPKST